MEPFVPTIIDLTLSPLKTNSTCESNNENPNEIADLTLCDIKATLKFEEQDTDHGEIVDLTVSPEKRNTVTQHPDDMFSNISSDSDQSFGLDTGSLSGSDSDLPSTLYPDS